MVKIDNYHKLKLSIRKINNDEIEIRHSQLGGAVRGGIRFLLIGMLLVSFYVDVIKHDKHLFYNEYNAIKEDFTWAFNPDEKIMQLYKKYQLREDFPNYFNDHPEHYPPIPYEDYRKPYVTEDFWKRHRAYLHFIWIPLLLFLFFLPKPRGLRLNRKHRMIYTSYASAPMPKGDPLSAVIYDRFGKHAFGGAGFLGIGGGLKYFSLGVTLFHKDHPLPVFFWCLSNT